MYNKVTLTRDFRRVAKAITKETADNFYRPDLKKGACVAVRTLVATPLPDTHLDWRRLLPDPHRARGESKAALRCSFNVLPCEVRPTDR